MCLDVIELAVKALERETLDRRVAGILQVAHIVIHDDRDGSAHQEIFASIDPVNFQIAAVLLGNKPRRQRPRESYVGTRTSDKPADVPGVRKGAQRIWVSGCKH